MMGGWYSFGGEIGKGGWGRCIFHDFLPVICREGDDLIESTASFPVRALNEDHDVLTGIELSDIPPILGFNQTELREGAEAILEIRGWESWHPLLAVHTRGEGKVSAFTTSASPHWGINLVKWPQYDQLWAQLFSIRET